MTRGKPVLDPARDLVGATPETLARALLRQPHLAPRAGRKPVVGDQVAVEEVPTDPDARRYRASAQAFLIPGCCAYPQTHERSDPYAWG